MRRTLILHLIHANLESHFPGLTITVGQINFQVLQVYSSADDQLLGTVEQEWTCWNYQFVVKDQHGRSAFRFGGGDCCWECGCSSTKFDVRFKANFELPSRPVLFTLVVLSDKS